MTVSCDLNDPVCQVRVSIGDAEMPYILDDAVIQFFIDTTDSIAHATVKAVEAAMAATSKHIDEETDEVKAKFSQLYDHFRLRYNDLLRDPSMAPFVALLSFGGVSRNERRRIYNDPDSSGSPVRQGAWDRGTRRTDRIPTDPFHVNGNFGLDDF